MRFSKDSLRGITLVELLVSMTILIALTGLLFKVLAVSHSAWGRARDQLGQSQMARISFETMSRRITDSVLNPYWGYEYPDGDKLKTPTRFGRQSELHFICGPAAGGSTPPLLDSSAQPSHAIFFHGPFGESGVPEWAEFNSLINGWGYYVEFGDNSAEQPPFVAAEGVSARKRFRLMELRIPADELETYNDIETFAEGSWYRQGIANGHTRLVAENVVALVITPEAPEGSLTHPTDIASEYYYDTRAFLGGGGFLCRETVSPPVASAPALHNGVDR
ncbi:hypothetical protein N9X25_09300 [Verrucomicrobiales bacterium]|nr:hypothetical protein [Verrucomicrobiales bacterium]